MQDKTERTISVRVAPRAARNRIVEDNGLLRIYVTVVPEGGKANEVVRKRLAKHIGVPKSALELVSGAKSRDKVFRIL